MQGPAAVLHTGRLQAGSWGAVLRNHRGRLRQLAYLRHGLLGGRHRLGVRQQEHVRGRLKLHAAYLRGFERRQLLRGDRGRLRRNASLQHDLPQGRLVVRPGSVQGRAGRPLRAENLHGGLRRSVLR